MQDLLSKGQELLSKVQDLLGKVQDLLSKGQDLLGKVQDLLSKVQDLLGKVQDLLGKVQDLLGKGQSLNRNYYSIANTENTILYYSIKCSTYAFFKAYIMSFQKEVAPFAHLLTKVQPSNISNDIYAQNYLTHLISNKEYYLSIYADVLDKAIKYSDKDASLLDFGCGNGLFALFAKYVGFNKVVACDVSETFLDAAQALSHQLQIPIEKWILGDENEVAKQVNNNSIDLWIGIDVIEHVYNLNSLFETIGAININMVTVFTTASVYENPIKRRTLQKLMLRDELMDSNAEQSSNNEYAGMAFYEIRKLLINKQFPNLPEIEIDYLAKQTRGLIKEDIYGMIQNEYIPNKTFFYTPPDAYNTCDPISGSFTERLLPIEAYKKLYTKQGIRLDIYNGFYNGTGNNVKSKCLKIANWAIKRLGKSGIIITPFIILVGHPSDFESRKKKIIW